MYAPAEDSYLLVDCVGRYTGKQALEIGVGSGLIADELCKNFQMVAGSDIDFQSIRYCRAKNKKIMLVCSDAASAFGGKARFDLIVSNPPYLPDDKQKDRAVHGGPTGIETTMQFVQSAMPLLSQEGRMLFVVSSHADTSALYELAGKLGLKKKIITEKNVFFERLSVVEFTCESVLL
ncbi:MAG: hypothetical protein DA330_08720 [Nitrososphaera sp.]|nr:hypothetical protein [Nitrososphaera sp.]